jgi:NAD(P)-dependent dehydrogenase (short-subunit alcohol dehydrogenase family)
MRSAGRRQSRKFGPQEAKRILFLPSFFLATDRASFIHGAKLAVDGGRTAI